MEDWRPDHLPTAIPVIRVRLCTSDDDDDSSYFQDLFHTPAFIYEELSHQADLVRTVLVLENLEEKDFFPQRPGAQFNLCHMRMVVKTVAKFHAISLAYKQTLFSSFSVQKAQVKANRQVSIHFTVFIFIITYSDTLFSSLLD